MSTLLYSTLMSLDGYIEDAAGKFDFAEPDLEVHQFINDMQRGVGVHLYGRRLYETMAVWETDPAFALESPVLQDFAETWQAADKIVYSQTLAAVVTTKTRLERRFDPDAIRHLKASAGRDILIGGATLAASAFRAGLVDECRLFLAPVTVGAGKPALPTDVRLALDLLEERRFHNGWVYLRYRIRTGL
jgi:dihydrofolate reductase